jgi:hypothetical protein
MRELLTGIFAFLVAASGWFYMFYSRAARNLAGVENPQMNRRRVILRRVGGFCMMLLAVCFFAGFNTFDEVESPQAFMLTWLAVMLLLILIVVLALIDVRLTWRMRRERQKRESGI